MQTPVDPNKSDLFGGVSDVRVPDAPFDFGSGIRLEPTKAHLMRPCMLAFEKPETSFPAWTSAGGSFGFDIVAEISVPAELHLEDWFDRANTIWWLAALLRLRGSPYLRVPVLSSASFSCIGGSSAFWPVESEWEKTRMILERNAEDLIKTEDLEWVKLHWLPGGRLMNKSSEFNLAVQAFDQSSFVKDPTLALLLLWSALEVLFSPGRSELRFRCSANIATFLEPPGASRHVLQQSIAKLYDARSAAAHGRPKDAEEPLIETYALLRRVLLKTIGDEQVPTISEIESNLFGAL